MGRSASQKRMCVSGLCCITLVLFTCLLIVMTLSFETIVRWKINESIKLSNGSMMLKIWMEKGSPYKFSIFIFNVTNAIEVLNGARPYLQEVGPFVYWVQNEKINVTWTSIDGSPALSYYKSFIYKFDRNISFGDPTKLKITSLSLPTLAISAASKSGLGPSPTVIAFLNLWVNPRLFTTQTIFDYIWGYTDDLLELCHQFSPERCNTDKVGLLLNANGTNRGPFIIDAGILNGASSRMFHAIQSKRSLDIWSTMENNRIQGTDGSQVAPNLRINSTRDVFVQTLCRPLRMTAIAENRPSNFDKLTVLEMEPDAAMFEPVDPRDTFCAAHPAGLRCPPNGLFDISSCISSGDVKPPLYGSMPNFVRADTASLRAPFDGLREGDRDRDAIRLFAEPKSGIIVEAHNRLQINALVEKSEEMIEVFGNLSGRLFFPIVWFEEDIKGSRESLSTLHRRVNQDPVSYFHLLLGLTFSVSFLLLLSTIIVSFQIYNRATQFYEKPRNRRMLKDDIDDEERREHSSVKQLISCPADCDSDVVRLLSFDFENQEFKRRNTLFII